MVTHDNAGRPEHSSQLFILRLWPEDVGSGQVDWRGKVQHVNSGEVRYFRDWLTLRAFLDALLGREQEGVRQGGGDAGTG